MRKGRCMHREGACAEPRRPSHNGHHGSQPRFSVARAGRRNVHEVSATMRASVAEERREAVRTCARIAMDAAHAEAHSILSRCTAERDIENGAGEEHAL